MCRLGPLVPFLPHEVLHEDMHVRSPCCLQSLLVSILAGSGVLDSTEDQKNLANFLICAEMLPAAIGMLFAFPYLEYKGTPCLRVSGRRHSLTAHAECVPLPPLFASVMFYVTP
jgi:hypothetical protein